MHISSGLSLGRYQAYSFLDNHLVFLTKISGFSRCGDESVTDFIDQSTKGSPPKFTSNVKRL